MIARALAAEADVLLLDDPTRGVDLGTKADLYRLFRNLAAEGRAMLWYSTDDCRVRPLRPHAGDARRRASSPSSAARTSRRSALVEAAFRVTGETGGVVARAGSPPSAARRREAIVSALIPLVTFALVFALCVALNPRILSSFGLTLVFSAAFALAFAAISQLFIIAAGDIDLGLGTFIGLVNAVAATWLVTDPWLAGAVLSSACSPPIR